MLPKIVVASTLERGAILKHLGLTKGSVMEYEGAEARVDELRHFVNFGVNVNMGSDGVELIVWDADRLSAECQAVLLKPLEEASENLCLYLVVANENGVLPTVMSRCVSVALSGDELKKDSFWKEILECFSVGPSKCLALADELEKMDMEIALEEVITKLKSGLSKEVNRNRLQVLNLAIDCLAKLRFSNVNAKLAFGNFLISSWKLIKA